MRTHSNRELARKLGLSETSIRKAERTGRIAREADGSWDVAKVQQAWRRNTDSAQQRRTPTHLKPTAAERTNTVAVSSREPGETGTSFVQARTANEVMKAQERKLKLQQLKGELVDRAKATALVFRLARQERDAWAQWPVRVAADLAAELALDTHTLQGVLERHVRRHLDELAELRIDLHV